MNDGYKNAKKFIIFYINRILELLILLKSFQGHKSIDFHVANDILLCLEFVKTS